MKKNLKKILTSFFIFAAPAAFAQVDIGNMVKPQDGEPINITSDNLIIKNEQNLSIFKDHVKVVQGTMNLKADQVRLYTVYDQKTKKNRFKRIEAEGNVDFKSEDKAAKSRLAVYDIDAGVLTLTDDVYLKNETTSLSGKVFKYYVKTGQSEISNSVVSASSADGKPAAKTTDSSDQSVTQTSGGRVKATFVPSEDVKNFHMPVNAIEGMKTKAKTGPDTPALPK